MDRPGWDEYYMSIARAVAARSNCIRRKVGAVIVVEKAIIGTGYNGAPIGVKTLRPCFGCAKEAIQAGIREIVYQEPYDYGDALEPVYRRLIAESGMALRPFPAP